MNQLAKTPLYQVIRRDIDDTHYYYVGDRFLPSVTKILDEGAPTPFALKQFFLNNTPESAEEIKNITGNLGTKMHDAFEQLLNGVELNLKDNYPTMKEKRHLICFYNWYNDFKPDALATEFTVASIAEGYAGTMDLLCQVDGKTWLIDFKTSSGIYYNHELQVVAYKKAYEEMYEEKVDHVAILRTNTKHKCGYEFKEITRDFQDFKNVFETYKSRYGGKIPEPPKIDVYPETLKL